MNIFLMHVGHNNAIDLDYTVKRKRSVTELVSALPSGSTERDFYESDSSLRRGFPDGRFNCWGVPPRAKPAFDETEIGDLVVFAPWIGVHGGGIQYAGIVRAIYRSEAWDSSRVFWPETPNDRLFPWIYFFETATGFRDWYSFLDDVGIGHGWNPRGWYKRIQPERFKSFGGPTGYVRFLRENGFPELTNG